MLAEFIDAGCATCSLSVAVPIGNKIYFAANDGSGRALWVSDGTPAGTHSFYTLPAGSTTRFYGIHVGDNFIFSIVDGGSVQLYASDGTASGTILLKDVNGHHFRYYNGAAYFFVDAGSSSQLWITDATPAGTTMLKDLQGIGETMDPPYMISTPASGGSRIWYSDGTSDGTVQLLQSTDITTDMVIVPMTADKMVFFTPRFDCATMQDVQLWVTDNTAGGTSLVTAFANTCYPDLIKRANGLAFFTVEESDASGEYLWQTDGTLAGTVEVDTTDKFTRTSNVFSFSSRLYFLGEIGSDSSLFSSQGKDAGGINQVHPSELGVDVPDFQYTAYNTVLYYLDLNGGRETFFSTDGTTASPMDFTADAFHDADSLFTSRFGFMAFGAYSQDGDWKIFSSDGTPNGTQAFFAPDPSIPANLSAEVFAETDNTLFFQTGTDTTNTYRLWASSNQPVIYHIYLPLVVK